MPQTVLERLNALESIVENLRVNPGPCPMNSIIIADELMDEVQNLKSLANASPRLFVALHDILSASQQNDVLLWKRVVSEAESVLARVEQGITEPHGAHP